LTVLVLDVGSYVQMVLKHQQGQFAGDQMQIKRNICL